MKRFEQWLQEQAVAVPNQSIKVLMKAAYNGALQAAADVAQAEYSANIGANIAPRSGDAAALNITNRIRAFMDKEASL